MIAELSYNFVFLLIGLFLVILSSNLVVKYAKIISDYLGISHTFIGLTILSIGTSLAELGTQVGASIEILKGVDLSGIAVGTNVGSNIIQISFIMGIVAFFHTLKADKKFLKVDYLFMLGAIALLFVTSLNGVISRFEGFLLAFIYILYLMRLSRKERVVNKINERKEKGKLYFPLFMLLMGLVALLFFSEIVVKKAHAIALIFNVADSLIGTLVVGVGTALPELTTAIVAARKKAGGISIGVLIGSNITNPLLIMGIGAMISTYTVTKDILFFDIPIWMFLSLVVLAFFWIKGRIGRRSALFLMLLYLAYIILRLAIFA